MSEKKSNDNRAALFRDRNFRWLLSGAVVTNLGDQFTLIALPWLVLKMTGDTLMLGMVLAVMSVPRALFILVGGALVDRYSPKRVLMLTKYANTVLLGLLAAGVFTGSLTLWMVYGLAFGIGLATAFSFPSGTAILPTVVQTEHLQGANSIMLVLRQFSMFVGPLLAGLMIALFSEGKSSVVTDAKGLGLAFLFDAFSFALSGWTLAQVAVRSAKAPGGPVNEQHVLKSVAEGLRYCWNDQSLRTCFLYWGAIAFFISGPIQIAMPVLAAKLGDSAAAFGMLVGAHGAGTLAGMVVSGIKPNLRAGNLGMTMLMIDCIIGVLFVPMGQISAVWQGTALLLIIGVLGGFLQVTVYTWMQRRVTQVMLGRTMSLFFFIFMGIAPISAAITGWVMRSVTVGQVFAGSGTLLICIVLIAFAVSRMRQISDLPSISGAKN